MELSFFELNLGTAISISPWWEEKVFTAMLNDVFRRLWKGLFVRAEDGSPSGLRVTGTSKKGTVVVGGGTGFVGKALCDELTKREVAKNTPDIIAFSSSRSLRSSTTSSWCLAPGAPAMSSPGKTWSGGGSPKTRRRLSTSRGETCSIRSNGGTTLSKKRWASNSHKVERGLTKRGLIFQVYTSRIDTSRSLNKAIARTEKGRRPKAYVQVTGVGYYPSGSQVGLTCTGVGRVN